jgi:hypothetical protein
MAVPQSRERKMARKTGGFDEEIRKAGKENEAVPVFLPSSFNNIARFRGGDCEEAPEHHLLLLVPLCLCVSLL